MTTVASALEYVQLTVFLVAAVLAGARWFARRGATRAWLAGTFGLLGVVVIAGYLMPERAETTAEVVAQKALICLLLLFPYFLYRFMASFEPVKPWLERSANAVVVAVLAFTLVLPSLPGPDEPRSALVTIYVVAVLAEWVFLSAAVTGRFWRAAEGQPTVARRRLRLLASGAAALTFALVITASGPSTDDVSARTIVVECIGILSALLFLAGFAPPPSLLRSWRARDMAAIQDAFVAAAQATSPDDVVSDLLPRVARLVGAQGAAIYRTDGELIGRAGATPGPVGEEGLALVPGVTQHGADRLTVDVPGGRLELFTSPYTPYFGRDELQLVRNVAALVYVTLERTYAHAREVAAREALDEAQRIAHLGSWRMELATGRIEASDEMYRLYGLEPGDGELTRERLMAQLHPDDRGTSVLADAIAAGLTDFTNEYRIVLPDGSQRCLAARGSLIADASGEVTYVIGTCLDVTEARRLDRMRSEFVANAAHELRTPLTTVSAMASLLAAQRDRLSAAELDGAFDALGRQGERARSLVSSLLDLSRLETGSVRITMAPTPVAEVVAQALETAPPPDGSAVTVDVPDELTAVTDADRLHEIVVNLLTNAYRYGGPSVSVSAHNGAGSIRLSVTDDGEGVPEGFVGELFQPFSRASSVTGTPGSGLGLTISHRLAKAVGGDLVYEPGDRGARFVVTLRVAA